MSGIDARELEFLRDRFEMDMGDPARNPGFERAASVREKLAAMGLDLNDDSTYDLLRPGLTKQGFDDLEYLGMTYYITRQFHSAQNLSWQKYSGITAASKHAQIEQLVKLLDHFAPALQARPLPAGADPYHRLILDMIAADYKSGRLAEYLADLAVENAVESYSNLQETWPRTQANLAGGDKQDHSRELQSDIYHIKDIRDLAAQMTGARRADFFARTGADEAGLDRLHKDIALALAGDAVRHGEPIPRYETGHTSNFAYQYSLGELDEAGVDMKDDATYDAIGMDRDTFWANYRTQVEWLKTSVNKPTKIYPQP